MTFGWKGGGWKRGRPSGRLSHHQRWFALDWTNMHQRSPTGTKIWEYFSSAATHKVFTGNIQQQLTCTRCQCQIDKRNQEQNVFCYFPACLFVSLLAVATNVWHNLHKTASLLLVYGKQGRGHLHICKYTNCSKEKQLFPLSFKHWVLFGFFAHLNKDQSILQQR